MTPKIIFIHGNGGGTGHDNWYLWCVRELKKYNIDAIAPDFPDSMFARSKFWLPFLKELGADEDTVLVGHSSGAVAALRYAEQNKIYGSVILGASYTDLGDDVEKQSGYFDTAWDWNAIKNNQHWIVQYASTDDPYIPILEARYIRDKLQTEYQEFTDEGHFGEDKGKTEFPEIVEELVRKLQLK